MRGLLTRNRRRPQDTHVPLTTKSGTLRSSIVETLPVWHVAKAVGILQPGYLPWLGYFEQMAYVDQFIFMDDVQYTKRDWRNRNRIKTANGPIWLTVPVPKHPLDTPLNAKEIIYAGFWVHKHLRSIELNYGKRPYFQPLFSEIEGVLLKRSERLVDLTTELIAVLCRHLDIDTPTALSSTVPRHEPVSGGDQQHLRDKNARIIAICRHFGADCLYGGKKSANFIDVDRFRQQGIDIIFQDYHHPIYPQAYGEFVPHMSAIDLIMNTGPDAPKVLRTSPVPDALQRWRLMPAC